jgi:hypothetical protein
MYLTPMFQVQKPATTWTLKTSIVDPPGKVYSTISAPYLNELYTFQAVIEEHIGLLEGFFVARPSNK